MGPRKTDILPGMLELIVLRLLRGGAANGWDITQSIQAVSRGILDVNYGSVYPTLRRLEGRGFVKAYWAASENNRRARYYELTTAGQKELALQKQEWEKRALAVGLILQSD